MGTQIEGYAPLQGEITYQYKQNTCKKNYIGDIIKYSPQSAGDPSKNRSSVPRACRRRWLKGVVLDLDEAPRENRGPAAR